MKDLSSPNFDERPTRRSVDILVLHYTGMSSAEAALDRLCDPAAKVSAHYLVDEDGEVFRLVAEDKRAWHAGVSQWAGNRDINASSIGIEIVNPGHEWGYRPFAESQMDALTELARAIVARHPIAPQCVLGHSDIAPERRQDPGELFDWRRLAAAGVGLVPGSAVSCVTANAAEPKSLELGDRGASVLQFQRELARYGYGVARSGTYDEATAAVVRAFQRHFRPARIDGTADGECQAALASLLTQITRKT